MFEPKMIVTTLPVTDLEEGKRFYGDTLGLKMLWESPASVRYSGGGGTELSIFKRGPSLADHTVGHFEVPDIEAAVRELEERGVNFIDYEDGPLKTTGHIAAIGPARGAWFRDPFGNTIGLREG